jgi:hypothetical protein
MPVRTHRYQIATLLFDPLDDFFDRLAIGELGFYGNAQRLKLCADFLQVRRVFSDLRADRIPAIGPGSPSIGHVQQYQSAVGEFCQLFDVLDNRAIGGRAVQRQENGVVHRGSISLLPTTCRG